MKSVKRFVVVLILIALFSNQVQSAQISNTRSASCLVKVTCNPAIIPLNSDTIDYLLRSSGVDGEARREVLDISPEQDYELFTIEYVQSLASDDLGGIGIPSSQSRMGRSSGRGWEMDEYEYAMMMEAEMGMGMGMGMGEYMPGPSTRSSRGRQRTRTPSTSRTFITTPDLPVDEQTYLFSLSVNLPEDVKPLAKEYMNALVDNLHQVLINAYDSYETKLKDLLQFTESRRDRAQSQLAKVMEQTKLTVSTPPIGRDPIDVAVYESLEQIVDLSNFTPSMNFVDVIEELENSVEPPLQIQPNWKDLLENAEIEPTTPTGIDPLTGIKLRKALDVLLAGVSSEFSELKYVVDEGVILIATADTLPKKMFPRVYEMPNLAYSAGGAKDLIVAIQEAIAPESWFEISDMGEATITPYPSHQPRKLAILQTYENHEKIEKFLKSVKLDIPTGKPSEVPEEILLEERRNLLTEKQSIEMELARIEGRVPAVEEQIERMKKEIDKKVMRDQVSDELRNILNLQIRHLEGVKKLVESGSVSISEFADAEEKIARAKIELAKRREQIGVSAGTGQLAKFSSELATLTIDMAEKKSMLKVIDSELNRIEQQLAASTMLDPQVSKVNQAVRSLEIINRRIDELNNLLLNVQPPMVSMLGAE